MIRLLLRLLGIRDFEVCASCATLKEQLEFERSEKKQLTETLLNILKPKTYEAPPVELNQVAQASALFSRRRSALEAKDREEARILKQSQHIGQPDNLIPNHPKTVEELEQELGIVEEETEHGK